MSSQMITTTHTLATDTLANGNDIDLVRTTAPDDVFGGM